MSGALAVAVVACALAVGLWLGRRLQAPWPAGGRDRGVAAPQPAAVRRILMPFTGTTISQRALESALRLAQAEGATLMPGYLVRVPLHLPLDAPLPRQCTSAMAILEAIEQRATLRGVPVDARIERGRSYRDALRRLLATERFDRVVVAASATGQAGLTGEDLVWLLDRAPAEVLILRPDPADRLAYDGVACPDGGRTALRPVREVW
ncbi:MAG TPA: universal stress protein [Solirubrobacteraceae bacterium]|nr:universal stress protein [Solirubrobacteraceae bacterium]